MPHYVNYRNEFRGHYALQGRPSATRLIEQDYFALPSILADLEKFAWCQRAAKKVGSGGLLHFNGRKVFIAPNLTGQSIKIFETLDGLEAEDEAGKFYFLPDYKTKICRPLEKFVCGSWIKDNSTYYFKPIRISKWLKSENQMSRVKTANNSRSICLKNDKGCSHLAVAQ